MTIGDKVRVEGVITEITQTADGVSYKVHFEGSRLMFKDIYATEKELVRA